MHNGANVHGCATRFITDEKVEMINRGKQVKKVVNFSRKALSVDAICRFIKINSISNCFFVSYAKPLSWLAVGSLSSRGIQIFRIIQFHFRRSPRHAIELREVEKKSARARQFRDKEQAQESRSRKSTFLIVYEFNYHIMDARHASIVKSLKNVNLNNCEIPL